MYKILIVEDEFIAAEYLKIILENKGWCVVGIVDNGEDALNYVQQYNPDLVLMDVMINGSQSGCEVAMKIRAISQCSIIFITAHADDEMISYAVDVKASGYIMKPYNEKEIEASISLLYAQKEPLLPQSIYKLEGGFHYDTQTNLLYKNLEIIKLGPKALKLIRFLCTNKETHFSYENIYGHIWNDEFNLKKLQMVVYRIRETCQVDFIENISSVGYRIKEEM